MNETAQLPAQPESRPPRAALIASGGRPTAIIPHTVEEMFRIAEAIHRSGLAPASQNTREKVMVAIMAGAELGMPPWQSVQSFAVIGNRPSIWGDAIPALLWSNGFKIKEWFEGEPYAEAYTAHCIVTRPDGTEIPGEFSVGDAKEASLWTKTGPWQTAKKRMLKMRARAFAARDGAADVLRGMQIREEVEDYVMGQVVGAGRSAAQPGGVRERLRNQQHHGETSGFSAEHVESELEQVADAETSDDDQDAQNAEFEERQQEHGPHISGDPVDGLSDEAEPQDELAPALIWADAVIEKLGAGDFQSVAELDAHCNDPDNARYFAELTEVDPARAKALNSQTRSVRKALLSKAAP